MLLLSGFPLKVTADTEAVGTVDEDLRGPVFLAVLLQKPHLEKWEDLPRHVFAHTAHSRPTLSCLFQWQSTVVLRCDDVQGMYTLCLLLFTLVCVNLTKVALKGCDRSIGRLLARPSKPVFTALFSHTELSQKLSLPERYAGSIIVFV